MIRIALNGNAGQLFGASPDQTPGINWKEVEEMAYMQGVEGLCLDGLTILKREITASGKGTGKQVLPLPDRATMMNWIGRVAVIEDRYRAHRDAIGKLADFYRENGIRMMVLKGYGLSLNWPVPEHRPTGDLDIYLYGEQERADKLLHDKLGLKVNISEEHHTVFRYEGLMVENHYDFIDVRAREGSNEIEAHLKALAKKAECSGEAGQNQDFYLPSPELNAAFLARHLAQHFAAQGVSLRQVLDWGLFVKANAGNIDWAVAGFGFEGKKDGAFYNSGKSFIHQINAICVDWLGIPEECFPPIKRDQKLEERILSDIMFPKFDKNPPKGKLADPIFRYRRWVAYRWKHKLIYDTALLPMFARLLWSHVSKNTKQKQ